MANQHAALNQQRGASLERLLTDIYHPALEREGRALITRYGQSARNIGGGRIVRQKSLPDYGGLIKVQGELIPVYFDVKVVATSSYSHPKSKLHQTDFLLRHDKFGAECFLLVVRQPIDDDDVAAFILYPSECWAKEWGKGWTVDLHGYPEIPIWNGADTFIPDWYQHVAMMRWEYSDD